MSKRYVINNFENALFCPSVRFSIPFDETHSKVFELSEKYFNNNEIQSFIESGLLVDVTQEVLEKKINTKQINTKQINTNEEQFDSYDDNENNILAENDSRGMHSTGHDHDVNRNIRVRKGASTSLLAEEDNAPKRSNVVLVEPDDRSIPAQDIRERAQKKN